MFRKTKDDESSNNNKKIKVFQTNARSLRNKFQELVGLTQVYDYEILCVTESWVSEKFNKDFLSEYEIPGYVGYFYQREERQGGGCILYVKDTFVVKNVHGVKLESNVESVWLDLETYNNVWLRIGVFYRSPGAPSGEDTNYVKSLNKKYVDEINRAVNSVSENHIVLVMGDFNYSDIDWELMHATNDISSAFLECVQDNFLEQVVHENTRGNNCLDLVLTNCSSIIGNMVILPPLGNSDHNSLSFDLDINVQCSANEKKNFNFKKGEYDKYKDLLSEIDWDTKFAEKNCNEMWETFKTTIEDLQTQCIPKVTARSGNFKHKPGWWDSDIGNLIKEKRKAYNKLKQNGYQETDLDNFRNIRDRVKSEIRKKGVQDDIKLGKEKNPKRLCI